VDLLSVKKRLLGVLRVALLMSKVRVTRDYFSTGINVRLLVHKSRSTELNNVLLGVTEV